MWGLSRVANGYPNVFEKDTSIKIFSNPIRNSKPSMQDLHEYYLKYKNLTAFLVIFEDMNFNEHSIHFKKKYFHPFQSKYTTMQL